MTDTSRSTGARMLRALRQRRGLSWSDTARALRQAAGDLGLSHIQQQALTSLKRNVARWESTTAPTVPDERNQLLLARLYAYTPSGTVAIGPGSDFEQLLTALSSHGVSPERLEELRAVAAGFQSNDGAGLLALLSPAASANLAAALADPQKLDGGVLADLRAVVDRVNRHVGTLPFVRLQLMLAPVVEACRRLTKHTAPSPLDSDLQLLATDTYTLTGRLAFETRDDTVSQALYAAAIQAAGKLPDTWHRATVHTSHTMVTLYSTNNPQAAQRAADAAVADAQASQSARIRARAHALQAELAARTGQTRHTWAALRLAWHALNTDPHGDPTSGTMTPGHLHGFEGVCQLHVGDPARAHAILDQAQATLTTPRDRVQRGIVTTDLALARLRMGAPEAAATLLHDCIELTATAGGRVAAQRIRQARLQLRPWRAEAFVADLDDHLHTTLPGA